MIPRRLPCRSHFADSVSRRALHRWRVELSVANGHAAHHSQRVQALPLTYMALCVRCRTWCAGTHQSATDLWPTPLMSVGKGGNLLGKPGCLTPVHNDPRPISNRKQFTVRYRTDGLQACSRLQTHAKIDIKYSMHTQRTCFR
jgi:hypothetical protein